MYVPLTSIGPTCQRQAHKPEMRGGHGHILLTYEWNFFWGVRGHLGGFSSRNWENYFGDRVHVAHTPFTICLHSKLAS